MIEFPFDKQIFVLAGPTAVGKTELSIELAQEFGCEIISVDSMQVYKYMDIGTAKVTTKERRGVSHHLIDIVEPDCNYDAAKFLDDCSDAIMEITSRGKIPLLTGGTGLYYKSLLDGLSKDIPSFSQIRNDIKSEYCDESNRGKLHRYVAGFDPESAKRIHQNDTGRLLRAAEIYLGTGTTWSEWIERHQDKKKSPRFTNVKAVCLTRPRDLLYARINLRCELMLSQGFEDEVRGLLGMGYDPACKSMCSIGYKHMCDFILGNIDKSAMIETMARDTRRYAKRQFTWFKKMEYLNWFDVEKQKDILSFFRNTEI